MPYPELLYPQEEPLLPSGFTMTVYRDPAARPDIDRQAEIGRPRAVADQLASCWTPPEAHEGDPREITIRLSFNRNGNPIGVPKVTYVKAGQGQDARNALVSSIHEALKTCSPLRFTGSMGRAIAGYPFAIRFIARAPTNNQP